MKAIMLILILGSSEGTVVDYHTVPLESMEQCQELRKVATVINAFNHEQREFYCVQR